MRGGDPVTSVAWPEKVNPIRWSIKNRSGGGVSREGLAFEKVRRVPQRHTAPWGLRGAGAPGRFFSCPKDPGAVSKSGQDAGGSQRTVSRGAHKAGGAASARGVNDHLVGKRGCLEGSGRRQGTALDQLRGPGGRSYPDAAPRTRG